MSVIEYGKCEVCGKEGVLFRTYFHYGFKCQCHSPNHFEFVRHCEECVPQKPTETKVVLSNEQAENLEPVKRGKWIKGECEWSERHCSVCAGYVHPVLDISRFRYCPHCGAKMECDEE